jgi:hypothetical protein
MKNEMFQWDSDICRGLLSLLYNQDFHVLVAGLGLFCMPLQPIYSHPLLLELSWLWLYEYQCGACMRISFSHFRHPVLYQISNKHVRLETVEHHCQSINTSTILYCTTHHWHKKSRYPYLDDPLLVGRKSQRYKSTQKGFRQASTKKYCWTAFKHELQDRWPIVMFNQYTGCKALWEKRHLASS